MVQSRKPDSQGTILMRKQYVFIPEYDMVRVYNILSTVFGAVDTDVAHGL